MNVAKVSAIVARYPNLQIAETGGGCTALRHELDSGGYLLLTSPEDARAPDDDDATVLCGAYGPDDEPLGEAVELAVDALEDWLDAELGFLP